tara:strand:+ start:742 stop:1074 length:333 start_codon:yes stop_codon:yes gene_type:complete
MIEEAIPRLAKQLDERFDATGNSLWRSEEELDLDTWHESGDTHFELNQSEDLTEYDFTPPLTGSGREALSDTGNPDLSGSHSAGAPNLKYSDFTFYVRRSGRTERDDMKA